jgi:D-alanyl-D-alanine endopeptidase (penicillin-binding protein 7)
MYKIFYLLLLTILYSGQVLAQESKPVKITATSWLVADENGKVIQGENVSEQRSIASITKLMTAIIVLDANQDLNERIGKFSRYELLQLMLIKSDNHAADLLCQHYPMGRANCINAMNMKAQEIGLHNTRYADPSGLNIMNISTAEDLIQLVIVASRYKVINDASNTAQGKAVAQTKKTKQSISFNNTNPLVATKEFIVSKTGYIRAAGGCIVMMLDTHLGKRIVVLLNSKNTYTRIPEAKFLAFNM